jgi:hypothetical protein
MGEITLLLLHGGELLGLAPLVPVTAVEEAGSGGYGQKNILPVLGIEHRFIGQPSYSLLVILHEMSRLASTVYERFGGGGG